MKETDLCPTHVNTEDLYAIPELNARKILKSIPQIPRLARRQVKFAQRQVKLAQRQMKLVCPKASDVCPSHADLHDPCANIPELTIMDARN